MSAKREHETPPRFDVRELAAIDMWGSAGAPWRRWIITVEFLAGVIFLSWLGATLLREDGIVPSVLGAWSIGIAVNYLVLSAFAVQLLQPGRLQATVSHLDVPSALRYCTIAQLRVAIPFLFFVLGSGRRLNRG